MNNIILNKMDNDAIDRGVIGLKLNKFNKMQELLCGLQNGFTLIGGDPNVGKTKFITNLFWDCVKSNKDYVGIYVSLDDSRDDILTNLVTIEAYNNNKEYNLSQTKAKQPYLLEDTNGLKMEYYESLERVLEIANKKRFFIYDIETIDSFDMMILHLNKILKNLNKKVFIMLDGVLNLDVSTKTKSDDLRVQGIVRANLLKQLADKNNLALTSTIELGKRKNDNKYKEPTYQDIMETGKFAYNAKLILLLSWNDLVEESSNTIYPKCRFAKNKFTGFKGSLHLEFNRGSGHVEINESDHAKRMYEEKLNIGRSKKDAREF
jgi:replicative DNA helicase